MAGPFDKSERRVLGSPPRFIAADPDRRPKEVL
jgi:hypothetical protein